MADYSDKEAKKLYPADFERLKAWRRAFCAPLGPHEVARLQQLSAKAQETVGRAHAGPGAGPRADRGSGGCLAASRREAVGGRARSEPR
jgi:hypothetical protein